jgi:hypothetical protein
MLERLRFLVRRYVLPALFRTIVHTCIDLETGEARWPLHAFVWLYERTFAPNPTTRPSNTTPRMDGEGASDAALAALTAPASPFTLHALVPRSLAGLRWRPFAFPLDDGRMADPRTPSRAKVAGAIARGILVDHILHAHGVVAELEPLVRAAFAPASRLARAFFLHASGAVAMFALLGERVLVSAKGLTLDRLGVEPSSFRALQRHTLAAFSRSRVVPSAEAAARAPRGSFLRGARAVWEAMRGLVAGLAEDPGEAEGVRRLGASLRGRMARDGPEDALATGIFLATFHHHAFAAGARPFQADVARFPDFVWRADPAAPPDADRQHAAAAAISATASTPPATLLDQARHLARSLPSPATHRYLQTLLRIDASAGAAWWRPSRACGSIRQ